MNEYKMQKVLASNPASCSCWSKQDFVLATCGQLGSAFVQSCAFRWIRCDQCHASLHSRRWRPSGFKPGCFKLTWPHAVAQLETDMKSQTLTTQVLLIRFVFALIELPGVSCLQVHDICCCRPCNPCRPWWPPSPPWSVFCCSACYKLRDIDLDVPRNCCTFLWQKKSPRPRES